MPDFSDNWDKEPDITKIRSAYALRAQDPGAALRLFTDLAQQGSVASRLYLGEMFRDGVGVSRDFDRASQFFREASELGSFSGLLSLGMLYVEQGFIQKAEEVFKRGASKNYSPAMDRLAMIYLKKGTPLYKPEEAKSLLERASSLGNRFAKRHLADLLLRYGPGVSDRFRGIRLLWEAFRGAKGYATEPHRSEFR